MLNLFARAKGYPVVFPLSHYVFGIVLSLSVSKACLVPLFSAGSVLFVLSLFIGKHGRSARIISLSLIFVWLGLYASVSKRERVNNAYLDTSYPRRIRGKIVDIPKISKWGTTFTAKITEIHDSGLPFEKSAIDAHVKIFLRVRCPELAKGQEASFLIWLSRNRQDLENRNVRFSYRGVVPSYRGVLKDRRELHKLDGGILNGAFSAARQKVNDELRIVGNDVKGVLKGILIGDKSDIERDLKRSFRAAGLSHILVVSGFHIGLVFAMFFFIFRFLLGRSRTILVKGNLILLCTVLASVPALFYALLAGTPYPTLRAMLMLLVMVVCIVLGRPVIGLNIFFWAVFVILLLDPFSLFSVSFELSAAAVFGIIYGLGKVRPLYIERLKTGAQSNRIKQKIKIYFLDLIVVTALAVLFTMPVALSYFSGFSTVAILTNLVLVPIFCFCIFPAGILGIFFSVLGLPGSVFIWKVTSPFVSLVNYIVSIVSGIPFSFIETGRIYFEDVFIYYCLVLLLLNLKLSRPRIAMALTLFFILLMKRLL